MATPDENPIYAPKVKTPSFHYRTDLNHLEEIKMHIRNMPYGDHMILAEKASTDGDISGSAKQLWNWAISESPG